MQCCGWEFNHTKGRKFKRTIPTETITWPRFTYIRQGRNFNSAFSHLNYCICRRGTALLLLLPLLFFFFLVFFLIYESPVATFMKNLEGGIPGRSERGGQLWVNTHTLERVQRQSFASKPLPTWAFLCPGPQVQALLRGKHQSLHQTIS